MRNLLALAIANLWTTMGASYTVKYFDCNDPVAVTSAGQGGLPTRDIQDLTEEVNPKTQRIFMHHLA